MKFFTHFGAYLIMLKGMFTKPENYKMYWKSILGELPTQQLVQDMQRQDLDIQPMQKSTE